MNKVRLLWEALIFVYYWKGTWNHKGRSGGDRDAADIILRLAEGMERVSTDSGRYIWRNQNEHFIYQWQPK